ncbi:MAG: YaiI/YqxD family protein [Ferrovibrio sp.]|uniref:YaiI/YqxD family protein n=1 Tax=Ferrovibrio sp. TaxID=1917215 RepID=UPI002633B511|nr:YaiI/YqxD family protein [Ferrovibrio sp.]MCW0232453.1 YaiI/YqxD family protein [Ferrovibrio sp.]
MTTIYVDADACPVKDEVYRVAERHGVDVVVVANSWLNVPRGLEWLRLQVVAEGLDKADDWIAETAGPGDVVITADVPLAARCVKTGALVLSPTGREFSAASIGADLATRNLMTDLRAANPTERVGGGPRPFAQKDRSAFLQALHGALEKLKRA